MGCSSAAEGEQNEPPACIYDELLIQGGSPHSGRVFAVVFGLPRPSLLCSLQWSFGGWPVQHKGQATRLV